MRGDGGNLYSESGTGVRAIARLAPADSACRRSLSLGQAALLLAALSAVGVGWIVEPVATGQVLTAALAALFMGVSIFRLVLVLASGTAAPSDLEPDQWPRYAVVCALYDEAAVVGRLIENLSRLDYPTDRLQGLIVLEADDLATWTAAHAVRRPPWLRIVVAPPGYPRTKPRALNIALKAVEADLLTVYDAEDRPHPGQLKEAAARFAADRSGRLACLQAPLRIQGGHRNARSSPFLDRQFAAEYAALFDVMLPGMARLRLPFPLGGTSNHFRMDALCEAGGWDPFNVTEDADLGFRLWRRGWTLGVISRPTWETPPGDLSQWLPQRTRWLKGYMQTLGVHTRAPYRLGARGLFALMITVGGGLAAAAAHEPSLAAATALLLMLSLSGLPLALPSMALMVFATGVASAWLCCLIGTRRAGTPYAWPDMLMAPAYWSLLSLAFGHAAWRLVSQPFFWDKTAHGVDDDACSPSLDEASAESLSAAHAAPEPVA